MFSALGQGETLYAPSPYPRNIPTRKNAKQEEGTAIQPKGLQP